MRWTKEAYEAQARRLDELAGTDMYPWHKPFATEGSTTPKVDTADRGVSTTHRRNEPNPAMVCAWRPIDQVRDEGLTAILGWRPGWPHAETLEWFPVNEAWGQESDSGRLTEFQPAWYTPIPKGPA